MRADRGAGDPSGNLGCLEVPKTGFHSVASDHSVGSVSGCSEGVSYVRADEWLDATTHAHLGGQVIMTVPFANGLEMKWGKLTSRPLPDGQPATTLRLTARVGITARYSGAHPGRT